MKNFLNTNRLTLIALIIITPVLISWGSYGHLRINRSAVFALPAQMQSFFFNHIDFITQEASIPDIRRYAINDLGEVPKHYFDLENFGSTDDSLFISMQEAKTMYPEEFLQLNGILPWHIQEMMAKLTKAFKEKRKTEILFLAADLGHYIGDVHTPLHTTVNYNGQLTGQTGIHSYWESQVTEMFGDGYNYYNGQAVYIDDIEKETWKILHATNLLVDTLLLLERELKLQMTPDKIYQVDQSGTIIKNRSDIPTYSAEFTNRYHQGLNGMIEKQLQLSIKATASFWYTAWVNAGKPDLTDLDSASQTKRNKSQLKRELKLYKLGKLMDL